MGNVEIERRVACLSTDFIRYGSAFKKYIYFSTILCFPLFLNNQLLLIEKRFLVSCYTFFENIHKKWIRELRLLSLI